MARENGHFTIHAGEAFGLPSIWEAIQWCNADRLGHGVRIVDDITTSVDGEVTLGTLASYIRDTRVPLEMCPTSNVNTGVCASVAEHPIGLLAELGFRVTVNTDNRLMSNVSLSGELHAVAEAFDYDWEQLRWFTVNAMKSAFLPFDERLHADQRRDQARLRGGERVSGPCWLTGDDPVMTAYHDRRVGPPGHRRARAVRADVPGGLPVRAVVAHRAQQAPRFS